MRCATIFALICASAASALVASSASAATLYYGGDPSTASSGYNEFNVLADDYVYRYAGVTVPAGQTWSVTGLTVINGNPGSSDPAAGHYEIRTNMTAGNGGTLVTSGDLPVSSSPTSGLNALNGGSVTNLKLLTLTLPAPLTFTAGQTFWFTLAPIASDSYHQFTGQGLDASSINALPSVQAYTFTAYTNPVTHLPVATFDPGPWRPTMGLLGSAVTAPEPTTLSLVGGAAILVMRRRK